MKNLGFTSVEALDVAVTWLEDRRESIGNRIATGMETAAARSGGDQFRFIGGAIDASFTLLLDILAQCVSHVVAENNQKISEDLQALEPQHKMPQQKP